MKNLYLALLLALCLSALVVRAQDDTDADTETEAADDVSGNVFAPSVKSLYAIRSYTMPALHRTSSCNSWCTIESVMKRSLCVF